MAKGRNRRQIQRRDEDRAATQGGGFAIQVQGTHFSGPVPPPEVLAKFEAIVPGAGERIFAMAERNQAHRHALEATVIPGNARNERWGQIFAFLIYLATLGCGTFLVYIGKELAGLTAMLATTGTFAGLFVYSRRKKDRELADKR